MSDAFMVLGQSYPAAATLTTLYTVPSNTSTTISSIVVSNQSSTTDKFRLSIAVSGSPDATKQYIYYDINILGNDTFIATVGFTLSATDVVRIQSQNGTCSFNLFGVQVT